MDDVQVSRSEIDALALALEQDGLPAQDLLRSFVAALRLAVVGDDSLSVSVVVEDVTVVRPAESVESVGSLQGAFAAAFVADPSADAPAGGRSLNVVVRKIGR